MVRLVSLVSLGLLSFVCLSFCVNQVASEKSIRVTLLKVLRELARRDHEADGVLPVPGPGAGDTDTTEGDAAQCSIFNEDTGKCRAGGPNKLLNDRPIFGVMEQEVTKPFPFLGDTYILATYIKFFEMAGARVVRIRVGKPFSYYKSMFEKINGLVFPGGNVRLLDSKYTEAARIMFHLAKEANDAGDHFPIVGFCLGNELLSAFVLNDNILADCDAQKLFLPLTMTPAGRRSEVFGGAPDNIFEILTTYNVTPHMHSRCISLQNFTKSNLGRYYTILSTNVARDGVEFVSTMKANKYPFYGMQWHPEKIRYVWDITVAFNTSQQTVELSQYMGNFFVGEARKSMHHYTNAQSEAEDMIENDKTTFLGAPSFQLVYYYSDLTVSVQEDKQKKLAFWKHLKAIDKGPPAYPPYYY